MGIKDWLKNHKKNLDEIHRHFYENDKELLNELRTDERILEQEKILIEEAIKELLKINPDELTENQLPDVKKRLSTIHDKLSVVDEKAGQEMSLTASEQTHLQKLRGLASVMLKD